MDREKRGPGDGGTSQGPTRDARTTERDNHASRSAPPTPLFSGNVEPIIAAGLPLIPLHRWDAVDRRGRPRGKSPRDARWQVKQYDSEREVASASGSGRNLGVRLPPGWLVLDVDPRNFPGGRDVLAEFTRDFALDLSPCPHTLTGSGGHHYWLRKPVDVATVDSLEGYEGIEFKSAGRQVVAPGSVHPNGRRYEWDDLAPDLPDAPPVPAALLERIRRPERRSSGGGVGELTPERLARTLDQLDPCDFKDHNRWEELMMSCHYATDGEGRQEFIEWSTGDLEYADDAWTIGNRWDSLHSDRGGEVRTTATLVKILSDKGKYLAPPDAAEDFDEWVDDEPPAKKGARWKLLGLDELESLPPPKWLIEGVLVERSPAVIFGPPESGKSFLALDLALSVASGTPWHGREVRRGNVLYIAAEGARGVGKRVRAWRLARRVDVDPASFRLMCSELNLASEREAEEFTRFVAESTSGLGLIVVDTLSQTATGADENSAQEMAAYLKRVQALVNATGATVLVIHHSGKDPTKGERGSIAILGNVDTSIEVTRPDEGTVVLTVRKQKDGEKEPPQRFSLEQVQFAGVDGEPSSSLVLAPAIVVAPPTADFSEFVDGMPGILGLAREMAMGSGRLKVSELVAAAMSRLGLSESAARREAKQIPEGRIDAVAAGDVWLWCERSGKHATAPLTVRSEPRK